MKKACVNGVKIDKWVLIISYPAHNGAGYYRLSRSPNVGICPPQPGSFDGPKQGPSGLNMVWDIISDNIPPHTLSTASAGSAIMYCII